MHVWRIPVSQGACYRKFRGTDPAAQYACMRNHCHPISTSGRAVPDPAQPNFSWAALLIREVRGSYFAPPTPTTTTCCLPSYLIHFQLLKRLLQEQHTIKYTTLKVSLNLNVLLSIRYVFILFRDSSSRALPRCNVPRLIFVPCRMSPEPWRGRGRGTLPAMVVLGTGFWLTRLNA